MAPIPVRQRRRAPGDADLLSSFPISSQEHSLKPNESSILRNAKQAMAMQGVRVIDAATFIAAPFAGTLLGEFGAEVIKVELPNVGDPCRRLGNASVSGDSFSWLTE